MISEIMASELVVSAMLAELKSASGYSCASVLSKVDVLTVDERPSLARKGQRSSEARSGSRRESEVGDSHLRGTDGSTPPPSSGSALDDNMDVILAVDNIGVNRRRRSGTGW